MANAFDKIAKKSNGTRSKTTTKIAAKVDDEIKTAVDLVVAHKAEIARLEAEREEKERLIIDHVRFQQDEEGFGGNFSKSFTVEGNSSELTYTTMDKWSVPQDEESQTEIKKVCGKFFDEFFETKRNISIRESALKDDDTLNKIAKACEKAGLSIGDIFDNTEKLITKKGLDENVYKLSEEKLETLRTLIKQNKPGLR